MAASSTSASSRTRSASPIAWASSAPTVRPVRISSFASGPDDPRQALCAPGARHDPQRHLGQAEDGGAAGEAEVGGERELAAAAERVAVDRGDRDLRGGRQRVESPLKHPVARVELGGGEAKQGLHVGAGREVPRSAGDDDRPKHRARVQRLRHGLEQVPHHLVERVDRGSLDAHDRETLIGRVRFKPDGIGCIVARHRVPSGRSVRRLPDRSYLVPTSQYRQWLFGRWVAGAIRVLRCPG
jgi:hypothetical protein